MQWSEAALSSPLDLLPSSSEMTGLFCMRSLFFPPAAGIAPRTVLFRHTIADKLRSLTICQ
ncbi:hypothetical protein [Nostoc sp.]|uniref:hypothetical protein n=1 Tax=Nostoc sp. TaxID=1180 RepID=UPI002FF8DA33